MSRIFAQAAGEVAQQPDEVQVHVEEQLLLGDGADEASPGVAQQMSVADAGQEDAGQEEPQTVEKTRSSGAARDLRSAAPPGTQPSQPSERGLLPVCPATPQAAGEVSQQPDEVQVHVEEQPLLRDGAVEAAGEVSQQPDEVQAHVEEQPLLRDGAVEAAGEVSQQPDEVQVHVEEQPLLRDGAVEASPGVARQMSVADAGQCRLQAQEKARSSAAARDLRCAAPSGSKPLQPPKKGLLPVCPATPQRALPISCGVLALGLLCAAGAVCLSKGNEKEQTIRAFKSRKLTPPLVEPLGWPETSAPTPALAASLPVEPTHAPTQAPWVIPTAQPTSAPPYAGEETVEQSGAQIGTGSDLRLLVIGSSNVVWMTWVPQLHLVLRRLGYQLPLLRTTVESDEELWPICDDTRWFWSLKTARIGKIGFSSWDFAYDSWEGCQQQGDASFRNIDGNVSVRCGQSPECDSTDQPVRVRRSSLANDALHADVVVLSTWINDHKGRNTNPPFKCFNGQEIEKEGTARVAVPNLLRLVRAIREVNDKAWILVMSEYPMTQNFQVWDETVPWIERLNAHVKEAIEQEPRARFVDYAMPSGLELYQKANYGHPNCRGSLLMAQGVVQTLYDSKVIERGLKINRNQEAVTTTDCSALANDKASCHASATCWVDPQDGACKTFSAGSDHPSSLKDVREMFQVD